MVKLSKFAEVISSPTCDDLPTPVNPVINPAYGQTTITHHDRRSHFDYQNFRGASIIINYIEMLPNAAPRLFLKTPLCRVKPNK